MFTNFSYLAKNIKRHQTNFMRFFFCDCYSISALLKWGHGYYKKVSALKSNCFNCCQLFPFTVGVLGLIVLIADFSSKPVITIFLATHCPSTCNHYPTSLSMKKWLSFHDIIYESLDYRELFQLKVFSVRGRHSFDLPTWIW